MSNLLVCTDLSQASERAFAVAGALAKTTGARITVLHALDPDAQLPPGALTLAPETQERFRQELRARAQARLLELIETHLSDLGEVDTDIIEGHGAARLICEHADAGGFDMVVIATHGRSALARMLIGSTAERVLRRATCPVLTVPAA